MQAHTVSDPQPKEGAFSQMEHSPWILYPTMILSIASLVAILWNALKFLNNINIEIIAIHKEMCKQSKQMVALEEKYQNTYFFLIRQHGIETVQRYFRSAERQSEEEHDHGD
jgi:hypothetical protein